MKTLYKINIALLVLLALNFSSNAQASFQAQAGLSYIEHLSLGFGCNLSNKHSISFLYGSNFFVHRKKFSTYLVQYKLSFNKMLFTNIKPAIGLKGGTTIFTDKYYRWNVLSLIPFIELQYPIDERFSLYVQGGCALSYEQSVIRVKYGEIGHYKDLLPEFKVGVLFNLITL